MGTRLPDWRALVPGLLGLPRTLAPSGSFQLWLLVGAICTRCFAKRPSHPSLDRLPARRRHSLWSALPSPRKAEPAGALRAEGAPAVRLRRLGRGPEHGGHGLRPGPAHRHRLRAGRHRQHGAAAGARKINYNLNTTLITCPDREYVKDLPGVLMGAPALAAQGVGPETLISRAKTLELVLASLCGPSPDVLSSRLNPESCAAKPSIPVFVSVLVRL